MTLNNRKAPREFWIVEKHSPYCPPIYVRSDIENPINKEFVKQLIHVREIDPTEPTEIERLNLLLDEAAEALNDTAKALFEGDTFIDSFLPDSKAHKQQTSVIHAHQILSKAIATINKEKMG